MAVKIHEFYRRYHESTALKLCGLQLASAGIAAGVGYGLSWLQFGPTATMAGMAGSFLALNLASIPLILRATGGPLRTVSQAIAHVSRDPVVTPPPDISKSAYERSGLRDLVQTVYELAAAAPKDTSANDAPGEAFRTIVQHLPAGVIVLGTDGSCMYANTAAPVWASPDNPHELHLIFDQNDDLQRWLTECRQTKVRDTHLWLRVADRLPGEADRRIFDVVGYYQKNDASGIEAILVTFDRTAIYAADQEDMDFIALAAHELRGPITVIRGYIDVFQQELDGSLNDDQRMLLERLQVSSERLSSYVNNILNVSRYDRDQFKLHLAQDNLKTIIDGVLPDLALRAKTQKRSVVFDIPADLPAVAADRSGISEVLSNLVDNAIKYSHDGGTVTVSSSTKDGFVETTVHDDGIGMPGSIVGNLFSRFYRSHRSRQAIPGTGLGLYICKAIVEAHGGSIWARSVEGQGSTFGFTLPTYDSVAAKLKAGDNGTQEITQRQEGWIKNHAMVRQ